VLIESMSPTFYAGIAQGPHHLETIRRLGYRSAIVVPLVARQNVLGALSLLRIDAPDPYTRDDLVLAVELARRAALAVDNARLFGAMRTLATTLQDSLLPRTIPNIPGVQISTRYRAAAEGQEVGGDFYDVFALDGQLWGLAIGDVCGKGPEAAALTAMARHTVRALAGPDPARVLASLNDALVVHPDVGPGRFLTLLLAIARPESGGLRLSVAAGGHPPAIVRRADDHVDLVPAHGSLLGMSAEVSYGTRECRLEPGDTLVLYTDGLTDARAPAVILSDEDLVGIVARAGGRRGADLAAYLEDAATAGESPRDDIALVVLDVAGGYPR
jgi:serine phosphatase RsbU (regulator of sigma subunit)